MNVGRYFSVRLHLNDKNAKGEGRELAGAEFPGIFLQVLMMQNESGISNVCTVMGGKDFRTSSTHVFNLVYMNAHFVSIIVVQPILL